MVSACEGGSPQTLAEGLGHAAQAQSAPHVQEGPQEQPPSHAVQPTCVAHRAQQSAGWQVGKVQAQPGQLMTNNPQMSAAQRSSSKRVQQLEYDAEPRRGASATDPLTLATQFRPACGELSVDMKK